MKNFQEKVTDVIFVRCAPDYQKNIVTEMDHLEEIYGYWQQKNISKKNILRLSESKDVEVSEIATSCTRLACCFLLKRKGLDVLQSKRLA